MGRELGRYRPEEILSPHAVSRAIYHLTSDPEPKKGQKSKQEELLGAPPACV